MIILPLLLVVIGALVYGFTGNSKVAELARILFFCALFWLVYMLIGHVVRF
jgi:uncharacterized membrane protein YtjA (UPF0391 family)